MNFDRLAPYYDWMEAITAGGRLQRARTCWLDRLSGRERVLSVGEGHGRFSQAYAARYPEARLTVLEASGRMLAKARRRLGSDASRVNWHQGDVLRWDPGVNFDALVTCFFLDCFPPDTLERVVGRLASMASSEALWLVVDFAVPSRGAARGRALLVHWLMYSFFRHAVGLPARRLTPPDGLLRKHGFRLVARREFEWGLIRADLWHRPVALSSSLVRT
jgi:cyclopropane fatty-acyl-phospholipid synthase-like methyltransferase